jgi:hypothetical protein
MFAAEILFKNFPVENFVERVLRTSTPSFFETLHDCRQRGLHPDRNDVSRGLVAHKILD